MRCNQKEAPLVEALSEYLQYGFVPFHMPGHKGGKTLLDEWRSLLGKQAFSIDLTEVEGLDDLHHPTGPIREAQALAADLMGAREAFFLTNGSSAGIHGVIMSLCGVGDKIIFPRHAHRSVYGAVILSGARPVYLKPFIDPKLGIPIGVNPLDVKSVLESHGDAKCLVMVHPTYHGFASDIKTIGKLASEKGIKFLVDEAHGAHFAFSSGFPVTALECGATASIQGWHKTMGSLTQSAMLLVNDQGLTVDYLTVLQSTSPSYLLMGSLDAARRQWSQEGRQIADRMLEISDNFRRNVKNIKGISCIDEESITSSVLAGFDKTKLLLNSWDIGLNGFQFAEELREKYRIQPEMAGYEGVTLMVTMGDEKERLDYLLQVLKDMVTRFSVQGTPGAFSWNDSFDAEAKLLPGEAFRMGKTAVGIEEAEGEISGEFICPYPPGIPLVVPGEVISRKTIEIIKNINKWGGHVQGPADSSGRTIRVVDERGKRKYGKVIG